MASVSNINQGAYGADPVRLIDMTLDLSVAGENVTSYATGGFALPAALDALVPDGFVGRSFAFKANTTHYAKWNNSTRKVQVYTDVTFTTEVSAMASLATTTALPLVVLGA